MFVLVSAIVGFKGWPQVGNQSTPPSVLAAQTRLPGGVRPTPALQAAIRAQTAGGGATAAAGPGAGPIGPARTGSGTSQSSVNQTEAPVRGSSGQPGGGTSTPSCTANCGQSPQRTLTGTAAQILGGTGNAAGTAVASTTSSVAGSLQGVSPAAAGAVKSTGATAGSVVSSTTGKLASAVQGLGGP